MRVAYLIAVGALLTTPGCVIAFVDADACTADTDCSPGDICLDAVCLEAGGARDGGAGRDGGGGPDPEGNEPDPGPTLDAGPSVSPEDAGADAGVDGGDERDGGTPPDAGSPVDGGNDAGPIDAGPLDAGLLPDGGAPAPVAIDDAFSLDEDQATFDLNVVDNDLIHPSTAVSVRASGALPDGVSLDTDGTIRLALPPDYFGVLDFSYTLDDVGTGFESDPASVTITINSVNDVPEIVSVTPTTVGLVGASSVSATVSAHDVEGTELSYLFSTDTPGITLAFAPNSPNVEIIGDGTTPTGNYIVVVVVTDEDDGSTAGAIPVNVGVSSISISFVPHASSLFPGESIVFDTSGSTTSASNLTFSWSLNALVAGVSLSAVDGPVVTLSVDRSIYNANNLPSGRSVVVDLVASDETTNMVPLSIPIEILDERGPYVLGNSGTNSPCGHILRPCSTVGDAVVTRESLASTQDPLPDDIRVNVATTVVETDSISMATNFNLRCGYETQPNGTWTQGTNKSRIDINARIGVRHTDVDATAISLCDLRVVDATIGSARVGITVDSAITLVDTDVIGATESGASRAWGVVLARSTQPSVFIDADIRGSTVTAVGQAAGLVAAAPVTITDSDFFGGLSTTSASGIVAEEGASIVLVGGTIEGGEALDNVYGATVFGNASVTLTSTTITGATAGLANRSVGIEMTGSGLTSVLDSEVLMGLAAVTSNEVGVSLEPELAGSMVLDGTDIKVVDAPSLGHPLLSKPIRTYRTNDSVTGSITMIDGQIDGRDATSTAYGTFGNRCLDIMLDEVIVTPGAAPTMIGVQAHTSCTVTLTDVDIDVDNGLATLVRRGVSTVESSLTFDDGTITLADAATEVAGFRVAGTLAADILTIIHDVDVVGARAAVARGFDTVAEASDVEILRSKFNGFSTATGTAVGLDLDNGCSRCVFGQLEIVHADSVATNTNSYGVRIHSTPSSGGLIVFSSLISPGVANFTAAIRTLGPSPLLEPSLSVRAVGNVLYSGTGIGLVHAGVHMRHENASDELAIDVVGNAIFAEQADAAGFLEACGNGPNTDGTRVGRAENNAFNSGAFATTLLVNARMQGNTCFLEGEDSIASYNGLAGYGEDAVDDTSIFAPLLFDDAVHPGGGSPVIDAAPSLLEYYPATAPQPFVDFDGDTRPDTDNDIGAIDP